MEVYHSAGMRRTSNWLIKNVIIAFLRAFIGITDRTTCDNEEWLMESLHQRKFLEQLIMRQRGWARAVAEAQLYSYREYGRPEVREAQSEHGWLPHCAELASVDGH